MKKEISLFVFFFLSCLYSCNSNEHLINEIKKHLDSLVAKEKITPDNFELSFDDNNPSKRFVSGVREANKVVLKLYCETEREEIIFEGLTSEQEIKDFSPSASEFVNKIKQIKTKPEEIKNLVKESLSELKSFDEITISPATDEGEDIKVVIIYQEKPADILISLNEFELTFKSTFFEQKFSISAPTEQYIKEQTKRVFENMVPHVRRSKLFSKTDSMFPMNKMTCRMLFAKESIISKLIKRLFPQVEIPEVAAGQGGSIEFPSTGTLTCKEVNMIEVSFVSLNFDFVEQSIESKKISFLSESMYPFEYIAEAFLEDLFRLVGYAFNSENLGEAIALYRPNGETISKTQNVVDDNPTTDNSTENNENNESKEENDETTQVTEDHPDIENEKSEDKENDDEINTSIEEDKINEEQDGHISSKDEEANLI